MFGVVWRCYLVHETTHHGQPPFDANGWATPVWQKGRAYSENKGRAVPRSRTLFYILVLCYIIDNMLYIRTEMSTFTDDHAQLPDVGAGVGTNQEDTVTTGNILSWG